MTVKIDVEAYAAEKQLRELSKTDKNKLRAERKRKKKERLAIMAKIDEYEAERCDACKNKPGINCDCSASQAIRDLGNRLGFSEKQKPGPKKLDPFEKFRNVTPETFTLEIYESMKAAKLTDRDIMSLLGWHSMKLNTWKREHSLVNVHKKHAPKSGRPKKGPTEEINGLTVDAYLTHKADSRSDAWISKKYGVPSSTLTRWKRANDVSASTKPQQAVQQPKGEKMMNDVVEVKESLEVAYKAKYEAAEDRIELFKDELKKSQFYVAELQQQLADANENANSEDMQKEIYSLTTELNRLKNYERDYRNLEVDYLNERTENERLKLMLDRLKHTAQINVWLMEQHVGFHKQLDEVMG